MLTRRQRLLWRVCTDEHGNTAGPDLPVIEVSTTDQQVTAPDAFQPLQCASSCRCNARIIDTNFLSFSAAPRSKAEGWRKQGLRYPPVTGDDPVLGTCHAARENALPDPDQKMAVPRRQWSGHLAEHKEHRRELAKWGNDLRQTYRTVAQAAGTADLDIHLLMNHAVPGANAGYITRSKLQRSLASPAGGNLAHDH